MYIKEKKVGKRTYYYLVEGVREGKKTRQRIIRYLGTKKPMLSQLKVGLWIPRPDSYLTKEEELVFEKIKDRFQKDWEGKTDTEKKKFLENFMYDFIYNTNAIEGSTLTLRDTYLVLKDGITPKDKPLEDSIEAKNTLSCFQMIMNKKERINLDFILRMHATLMFGASDAGKLRQSRARITVSRFVPPKPGELRGLLVKFYKWYDTSKRKLNPVALAALIHLRFVTIHPFSDGNGRISRFLMNKVLKDNGYPLIAIKKTERRSYYSALERSQLSGDETIFVNWLKRRYAKRRRMG